MGRRKLGLARRIKNHERKRQALIKKKPPGRPHKNPEPEEVNYTHIIIFSFLVLYIKLTLFSAIYQYFKGIFAVACPMD